MQAHLKMYATSSGHRRFVLIGLMIVSHVCGCDSRHDSVHAVASDVPGVRLVQAIDPKFPRLSLELAGSSGANTNGQVSFALTYHITGAPERLEKEPIHVYVNGVERIAMPGQYAFASGSAIEGEKWEDYWNSKISEFVEWIKEPSEPLGDLYSVQVSVCGSVSNPVYVRFPGPSITR